LTFIFLTNLKTERRK